jgi:hypothetical protein
MAPDLRLQQQLNSSYCEIYRIIREDLSVDRQMVEEALHKKAHFVDWAHTDIIDLVLSMKEEEKAEKEKQLRFAENPSV